MILNWQIFFCKLVVSCTELFGKLNQVIDNANCILFKQTDKASCTVFHQLSRLQKSKGKRLGRVILSSCVTNFIQAFPMAVGQLIVSK